MDENKDFIIDCDASPKVEPETNPDPDLIEFSNDSRTLEHTIDEGKTIRERKRVSTPKPRRYQVIEADRSAQSKVRNKSIPLTRNSGVRTSSCSPRRRQASPISKRFSLSPTPKSPRKVSSPTTPRSQATSSRVQEKKTIKCPLRIAELAEPKKRHCIETLREENTTLPAYMIERLKQQILSQKPLVEVPDAIECFKRKLHTRRADKTMSARRKKAIAKQQKEELTAYINWATIFINKVAQRLLKPQRITLNDGHERLSDLIAMELSQIIGQPKKFHCDYMNEEILTEMSNKITVWIAGILSDVEYKMLEDELRAKKRKENQSGKDGNLCTLIEQYILMRFQGQSSDLEEEEGPALDVLDSLIDKIVSICIPDVPEDESKSRISEGDTEYSSRSDSEGSASQTPENRSYPSDTPEEFTNYVVQYEGEGESDFPKKPSSTLFPSISSVTEGVQLQAQDIDDLNLKDNKDTFSGDLQSNDQMPEAPIPDKLSLDEYDMQSIINAIFDHANLNVSDVFMSEDKNDDKKKVKFTKVDTDSRVGSVEINIKEEIYKHLNKPVHSKNSNSFIRPDIVLAAPNESLLSLADELWPNDIITAMMKASESVSKSVTSLGNITEYDDEKLEGFESQQEVHDAMNNKNENLEHTLSVVEFENKDEKKASEATLKTALDRILLYEQEKDEKKNYRKSSNQIASNYENMNDLNPYGDFYDDHEGKKNKKEDRNVDSDLDSVSEIIQRKLRSLKDMDESKFNYKVDLDKAPSWVLHSQSEETLLQSAIKKDNMGIWEIRQWCKDLEQTAINLEQWGAWIDSKCHKMLMLKLETETRPDNYKRHLKEWTRFKKHTDEDALLWRKSKKHTLGVLETYSLGKYSGHGKAKYSENDELVEFTENKSVFEAMYVFDQICLWTHRLIVSTEYSVKCECSKNKKSNCNTTSHKTKSRH